MSAGRLIQNMARAARQGKVYFVCACTADGKDVMQQADWGLDPAS